MIRAVLDLSAIPTLDLSPLPVDLRDAVTTVVLPFVHLCPFCGVRPAGLGEGGCGEPDCRTRFLDTDRAHERASDQ